MKMKRLCLLLLCAFGLAISASAQCGTSCQQVDCNVGQTELCTGEGYLCSVTVSYVCFNADGSLCGQYNIGPYCTNVCVCCDTCLNQEAPARPHVRPTLAQIVMQRARAAAMKRRPA